MQNLSKKMVLVFTMVLPMVLTAGICLAEEETKGVTPEIPEPLLNLAKAIPFMLLKIGLVIVSILVIWMLFDLLLRRLLRK